LIEEKNLLIIKPRHLYGNMCLINQSEMSVECFRLSESEGWVSQSYGLGDEVYFNSIDFRCDVAAIYRKVGSWEGGCC
jgi:Uma2 family endonuclease